MDNNVTKEKYESQANNVTTNIDNSKGKCQISENFTDNPYQYNIQDAKNHITRETQQQIIK
jgi:hypothetical protein